VSTVDDLLAQITPVERIVSICTRGDLADKLDQAKTVLADAIINAEDDSDITGGAARGLSQQVADIEAEIADSALEFRVRSLGSGDWRRLMAAHPPLEDGLRWNPETFGPAALAACVILPGESTPNMTMDDARRLCDALTAYQSDKLLGVVLTVNMDDDVLPKSNVGSSLTRSFAPR
jgi:hypothetical protein